MDSRTNGTVVSVFSGPLVTFAPDGSVRYYDDRHHSDWDVDPIPGTDSVMYEQHNPDYISREQGGPVVVSADSQNDRVVEYQRRNGEWETTWVWVVDFDRFATGAVYRPYEAERLGTGGESAGGPSAAKAGLQSKRPAAEPASGLGGVKNAVEAAIPPKVFNAITLVTPGWMGFKSLLALVGALCTLVVWAGVERY